jgi:hypothetical protein
MNRKMTFFARGVWCGLPVRGVSDFWSGFAPAAWADSPSIEASAIEPTPSAHCENRCRRVMSRRSGRSTGSKLDAIAVLVSLSLQVADRSRDE